MRKLLRANLARMRRSKVFWLEMLVLTALELSMLLDGYLYAKKIDESLSRVFSESIFQGMVLSGILFAVFCSLFMGTEYDFGTIRNKLVIGHSRTNIYLSGFVSCLGAAAVQCVVAVAVLLAVGFLVAGQPDMEAGTFFRLFTVLLFLCMAYVSVYHLFAMLITSKSHASTVNILLAFALLIFATALYSRLNEPKMMHDISYSIDGMLQIGEQMVPNPNYVSGTKRVIYQFLVDFLPGGQNIQIANAGMQAELCQHTLLSCAYSALITVGMNAVGLFLFRRKDLK